MARPLVGGATHARAPTDEDKQLVESVRGAIETRKADLRGLAATVLQVKTQVVNGTNFFLKVRFGDNKVVHLRIHKSLKNEVSLAGLQDGRAEADELAPFDAN